MPCQLLNTLPPRSRFYPGSSSSNNYLSTATSYCMNLFWGVYGGDWEATYGRWSNNPLGVPEQDRNAWADSCPNMAGWVAGAVREAGNVTLIQ